MGIQVTVEYTTGEKLATEVSHHFGDLWAVAFSGQQLGTVLYNDTTRTWSAHIPGRAKSPSFPTRGEAVAHVTQNTIKAPLAWIKHRMALEAESACY